MYQREKDRRLYENSVIVNENARLAIQKQSKVVSCLAQLSSVLSRGLYMPMASASEKQTSAGTMTRLLETILCQEKVDNPSTIVAGPTHTTLTIAVGFPCTTPTTAQGGRSDPILMSK